MKQKIKLDPFEKEIEAHVDKFVPIRGEKRFRIKAILERSRKSKNTNIRISEYNLNHLNRGPKRAISAFRFSSGSLSKFGKFDNEIKSCLNISDKI